MVEWSGPYSYDEIIHNTKKKNYDVTPDNFGLYQIYGAHPLYGNGVLIYIGKTIKPFSKRLKGRGIILHNIDSENIQIYLGRVFNDNTAKNDNVHGDILRAESLLIHYHRPAHNSSNINTLQYANEDIRVINIGCYRDLHIEISTKAFTKDLEIYSMIDSIAKELKITKNKYEEEDGYGYFLDKNKKIWFGVDYVMWDSEITLVLLSEEKIDQDFEEFDYTETEGKGYYRPLYGDEKYIAADISKYKSM